MAKEQPQGAPNLRLLRHVVLVGLMGAGKSSIGRRLAVHIAAPFIDADTEIECAARMSIPDIFASHGEAAFRDVERRVIARLASTPEPMILATGGGAFMNDDTRMLLLKNSTTIWLKAELAVLVDRVGKRGGRPLLEGRDLSETLRNLIEIRHPIYAQAELTVTSRNEPHEIAVNEIITTLRARHELEPTP